MTACGSSKDSTGGLKKLDDATVDSLVESFGGVVGNIADLDEESIAGLMEGDDAFSASAAVAWDGAGEDLAHMWRHPKAKWRSKTAAIS